MKIFKMKVVLVIDNNEFIKAAIMRTRNDIVDVKPLTAKYFDFKDLNTAKSIRNDWWRLLQTDIIPTDEHFTLVATPLLTDILAGCNGVETL